MAGSDEQRETDEAAREARLIEGWGSAVPAVIALAASSAQVVATLRRHEAFGTEATLALITLVACAALVAQAVAYGLRHRRNGNASHRGGASP